MKILTQTTEIYTVDTEEEVKELIEEAKQCGDYSLTKYTSQYKEKKQKGEILYTYYKVSLTKVYSDGEGAF